LISYSSDQIGGRYLNKDRWVDNAPKERDLSPHLLAVKKEHGSQWSPSIHKKSHPIDLASPHPHMMELIVGGGG
jgi:hypothetical protein